MNKIFYYTLSIILLMGLGASWVIQKARFSHDLPVIKLVPDFSFTNQYGEIFTQDNLRGKVSVLDFFFTSCAGPCPIMTYNMKELYNDFSQINEVQFISITVDPILDTKLKLKEYAEIQGVYDKRWQFLFSDLEQIKNLKKNGFMLYADQLPQGHAIKFILIDENGKIRKYFDGTDDASQAVLRENITHLLRNFKS